MAKKDDFLDIFKEEAEKILSDTEDKISLVENKVRKYIKQHPEKAALIALGIGAMIGSEAKKIISKKSPKKNSRKKRPKS